MAQPKTKIDFEHHLSGNRLVTKGFYAGAQIAMASNLAGRDVADAQIEHEDRIRADFANKRHVPDYGAA